MIKRNNYQDFLPIILFSILLVVSYLIIKPFLLIIFLASLLAYMLHPVYNRINLKIKRENLSALLVCILIITMIILPVSYILKTLTEESYNLYVLISNGVLTDIVTNCSSGLCESIQNIITNPQIKFYLQDILNKSANYLIAKTSEILLGIPTLIINLFVLLFTTYYLLRDGQNLVERVGYYLSMQKKKYATIIFRLKEVTEGIIYGYFLVALIQGILGGLGFFILGISSPIFWGIIMGFLALIPILGTGIIWIPAALILIFNGSQNENNIEIFKGIGLLVYGLIIVSGIDNVLRPKIISEKAKIHPGIVLIGILGGLFLFGPFGVIIGPLILSLASIIVETYLGNKPNKKELHKFFKAS